MSASMRRVGRLVVLPLVVAGVTIRFVRRHHDRKADAELWAAATDAAASVAGSSTDQGT